MKVGCARCDRVFESLVIEPEIAWKDIFIDLTTHVCKQHPKFHKKVMDSIEGAQMTILSYLAITETTKTIEDNKWLDERIEQMRDIIMRSIGYEPVEDEEIETEEEEKEDNKEEEETPVFEEAD